MEVPTAHAAVDNGFSFHYWAFSDADGFDAYDVAVDQWLPGFPDALLR